jgi:hypothetical protein
MTCGQASRRHERRMWLPDFEVRTPAFNSTGARIPAANRSNPVPATASKPRRNELPHTTRERRENGSPRTKWRRGLVPCFRREARLHAAPHISRGAAAAAPHTSRGAAAEDSPARKRWVGTQTRPSPGGTAPRSRGREPEGVLVRAAHLRADSLHVVQEVRQQEVR